MPDADGLTGADPRRRVLARFESEPIPYGTWSALFDTLSEAAALDMGVMLGGHVVDCADDGWQPAEGAEPESWRSSPVEHVRLRAQFAVLAGALEAEAAEFARSAYPHERGDASGRTTAAFRIRRILTGGTDEI